LASSTKPEVTRVTGAHDRLAPRRAHSSRSFYGAKYGELLCESSCSPWPPWSPWRAAPGPETKKSRAGRPRLAPSRRRRSTRAPPPITPARVHVSPRINSRHRRGHGDHARSRANPCPAPPQHLPALRLFRHRRQRRFRRPRLVRQRRPLRRRPGSRARFRAKALMATRRLGPPRWQ
jgi:hypothetical protein